MDRGIKADMPVFSGFSGVPSPQVKGNTVDPGIYVGFLAEFIVVLVYAEECLACKVFGILPVPCQPQQEIEDTLFVPAEYFFKSGFSAVNNRILRLLKIDYGDR